MSTITEEKTEISDVKGIGPKLAERIQQTLNVQTVEELTELTEDQLKEVKGIGSSKAEKIISNIKELTEECDRCGKRFVGEDTCPKCTTELEEKFEPIKKEVEYFKNDNFQEKRWHLVKTLEEIDSGLSEGRFEETEELIESVHGELEEIRDISNKLSEIENKLQEEKVINLSTYKEELELAWKYLRYGDYEESHNRAEKVLDYLEEEEIYEGVEKSKLLEENIEDFSTHMMRVGPRAGEKIYGSGFRTLEDVYKAGPEELQKKTDIEESTARRLMNALDLLFEDIDIERGGKKEPFTIREDQKTEKEEEIFRDTRKEKEKLKEEKEKKEEEIEVKEEKETKETSEVSETEEKEKTERPKETKKDKKKNVVKRKPQKKEEPMSVDELLSMEEEPIQKNERELKYWIPAIIIPIVLAIAAYVLFLM
ncbi:MAG: helix-hairpin-helix domain-containing protein [Candidatus Thermoplasmatota archaeon]